MIINVKTTLETEDFLTVCCQSCYTKTIWSMYMDILQNLQDNVEEQYQ